MLSYPRPAGLCYFSQCVFSELREPGEHTAINMHCDMTLKSRHFATKDHYFQVGAKTLLDPMMNRP